MAERITIDELLNNDQFMLLILVAMVFLMLGTALGWFG